MTNPELELMHCCLISPENEYHKYLCNSAQEIPDNFRSRYADVPNNIMLPTITKNLNLAVVYIVKTINTVLSFGINLRYDSWTNYSSRLNLIYCRDFDQMKFVAGLCNRQTR